MTIRNEFGDVMYRFHIWLKQHNVPDADKVRIEIHFPTAHAQHYASAELMREMAAMSNLTLNRTTAPIEPETVEFFGHKITFTNPERWDRKRP